MVGKIYAEIVVDRVRRRDLEQGGGVQIISSH